MRYWETLFLSPSFGFVTSCSPSWNCFGLSWLSSVLMKSRFIPLPENARVNSGLWFSLLTCLLHLAGSEAIAVEHLPEQKRKTVWKISGDIRGRAADLLREMWDAIGWHVIDEDRNRFQLDIFGGFQVQCLVVRPVWLGCSQSLFSPPPRCSKGRRPCSSLPSSAWSGLSMKTSLACSARSLPVWMTFSNPCFLAWRLWQRFLLLTTSQFLPHWPWGWGLSLHHCSNWWCWRIPDLLLDLYRVPPGDAYNDNKNLPCS